MFDAVCWLLFIISFLVMRVVRVAMLSVVCCSLFAFVVCCCVLAVRCWSLRVARC